MARYSDQYYKNILAKLLRLSLTNTEPAKELIEQMFDDDEFKNQAISLCESYMKPKYRESTLISKSIDVRALPALVKICKRDKLGIIPLDFTGEENHIYSNGDKINVLILSLQSEEFERAALEACAVSGVADEMLRKYADIFAKDLKDKNPMVEITGLSEMEYESMKKQIQKLPQSLQFTLFPKKQENGKINVGFFYQSDVITLKKGKKTEKSGPYLIPKIAAVMLACSLLDDPKVDKEYDEKMKKNKVIMNMILDMFNEDDKFYLVPAIINKDNLFNVFMDKAVYYDFDTNTVPDYEEYENYVESKMNGLNHTLMLLTQEEYELYQNEITINPKTISFYKKAPIPEYMPPDLMRGKKISERLIDILNRKREQIMLASDDHNGKNLINIENFISGTVNEMIMREDEDYSDWLENEEILDGKELELLHDLDEKYTIGYVYEDHDKVSELIRNERDNISIEKSKETEERER